MQRIKVSLLEQSLRLTTAPGIPSSREGGWKSYLSPVRLLTISFSDCEWETRETIRTLAGPRDPAGISALEYEVHDHTIR